MSEQKYLVSLPNTKTNILEFDLNVSGVSIANASVFFIIEATEMNLSFEAKKLNQKKWEVTIPPLPMLKRTMYPLKITLSTEGYYFEPLSGSVNITGTGSVSVASIKGIESKVRPSDAKDLKIAFGDTNKETTLTPKKITKSSDAKKIFDTISKVETPSEEKKEKPEPIIKKATKKKAEPKKETKPEAKKSTPVKKETKKAAPVKKASTKKPEKATKEPEKKEDKKLKETETDISTIVRDAIKRVGAKKIPVERRPTFKKLKETKLEPVDEPKAASPEKVEPRSFDDKAETAKRIIHEMAESQKKASTEGRTTKKAFKKVDPSAKVIEESKTPDVPAKITIDLSDLKKDEPVLKEKKKMPLKKRGVIET